MRFFEISERKEGDNMGMNGVSGINPAMSNTQMTTATGGTHIVEQTLRAREAIPTNFTFSDVSDLRFTGIGGSFDIFV